MDSNTESVYKNNGSGSDRTWSAILTWTPARSRDGFSGRFGYCSCTREVATAVGPEVKVATGRHQGTPSLAGASTRLDCFCFSGNIIFRGKLNKSLVTRNTGTRTCKTRDLFCFISSLTNQYLYPQSSRFHRQYLFLRSLIMKADKMISSSKRSPVRSQEWCQARGSLPQTVGWGWGWGRPGSPWEEGWATSSPAMCCTRRRNRHLILYGNCSTNPLCPVGFDLMLF